MVPLCKNVLFCKNAKKKKREASLKQQRHLKRYENALAKRAEKETYYLQQEIRKVQTKNAQIINSPTQDSE